MKKVVFAVLWGLHFAQVAVAASARDLSSALTLNITNKSHNLVSVSFLNRVHQSLVLMPEQNSLPIVTTHDDTIQMHTSAGIWIVESNLEQQLLTLAQLKHKKQYDGTSLMYKEPVQQMPISIARNNLYMINSFGAVGMFAREFEQPLMPNPVVATTEFRDCSVSTDDIEQLMGGRTIMADVACQIVEESIADEVEEVKVPEQFTDMQQCRAWIDCGIFQDSADLVKHVVQEFSLLSVVGLRNHLDGINGHSSALLHAVSLCKSNAVKALLECGASPNLFCVITQPVVKAPFSGRGAVTHKLTHYAATLGDLKSTLYLVRHGGDFFGVVNGGHQQTIMRYVIGHYNNDPDVACELIQELFDRGYKNDDSTGKIFNEKMNVWALAINLVYSAEGEFANLGLNKRLVELFVKNGADINAKICGNGRGSDTPLSLAVKKSRSGSYDDIGLNDVELLLEAGADINKPFQDEVYSRDSSVVPLFGHRKEPQNSKMRALLQKYR